MGRWRGKFRLFRHHNARMCAPSTAVQQGGQSKMIQNCMFCFSVKRLKLVGCGYTLNEPSRKLVLPISALTSTGLPDAAV